MAKWGIDIDAIYTSPTLSTWFKEEQKKEETVKQSAAVKPANVIPLSQSGAMTIESGQADVVRSSGISLSFVIGLLLFLWVIK